MFWTGFFCGIGFTILAAVAFFWIAIPWEGGAALNLDDLDNEYGEEWKDT